MSTQELLQKNWVSIHQSSGCSLERLEYREWQNWRVSKQWCWAGKSVDHSICQYESLQLLIAVECFSEQAVNRSRCQWGQNTLREIFSDELFHSFTLQTCDLLYFQEGELEILCARDWTRGGFIFIFFSFKKMQPLNHLSFSKNFSCYKDR